MKIVIQRVKSASVSIDGVIKEKINQGFLLLVGVEDADSNFDLDYAVRKIVQMRIFSDEADKMNLSVQDIQGEILSISQFTLYAETKKGNRPSFSAAGKPDLTKLVKFGKIILLAHLITVIQKSRLENNKVKT